MVRGTTRNQNDRELLNEQKDILRGYRIILGVYMEEKIDSFVNACQSKDRQHITKYVESQLKDALEQLNHVKNNHGILSGERDFQDGIYQGIYTVLQALKQVPLEEAIRHARASMPREIKR